MDRLNSLPARVLIYTTIWSAIGVAIMAVVISTLYERSAEKGLRDLLRAQLFSAINSVSIDTATKKLTNTDSPFAIVFWMMLIQLPLALIASDPLFPARLDWGQAPAVIGIGLSGLASHYCLTRAFRVGDAGVVVPLDFMRIPLIAVIGWWLYGEPLDGFVFLGAGLILAGILWNLRSEAARTAAA